MTCSWACLLAPPQLTLKHGAEAAHARTEDFIQGSGGDQAHLLCKLLEDKGYRVWHDNSQRADQRNLQGMKKGVRESECLMIFLSGRKEKGGKLDSAGEYEGPFTRWFCHEEMATAHAESLRCIGVMET